MSRCFLNARWPLGLSTTGFYPRLHHVSCIETLVHAGRLLPYDAPLKRLSLLFHALLLIKMKSNRCWKPLFSLFICFVGYTRIFIFNVCSVLIITMICIESSLPVKCFPFSLKPLGCVIRKPSQSSELSSHALSRYFIFYKKFFDESFI